MKNKLKLLIAKRVEDNEIAVFIFKNNKYVLINCQPIMKVSIESFESAGSPTRRRNGSGPEDIISDWVDVYQKNGYTVHTKNIS